MPKRFDPKKKRRDWRWYASFGLNSVVALSMVLGSVFVFTGIGSPSASPPPTFEVPTLAPATPVPLPTPTPKASADYWLAGVDDFFDAATL